MFRALSINISELDNFFRSSEMEFALTVLCSITNKDPRFKDNHLIEIFGKSLEQKREILSDFHHKYWCGEPNFD